MVLVPTLERADPCLYPEAAAFLRWAATSARLKWLTRERPETCQAVARLAGLTASQVTTAKWTQRKADAVLRHHRRGGTFVWLEDDPLQEDCALLEAAGLLERLVRVDFKVGVTAANQARVAALLTRG